MIYKQKKNSRVHNEERAFREVDFSGHIEINKNKKTLVNYRNRLCHSLRVHLAKTQTLQNNHKRTGSYRELSCPTSDRDTVHRKKIPKFIFFINKRLLSYYHAFLYRAISNLILITEIIFDALNLSVQIIIRSSKKLKDIKLKNW